MSGAKDRKVLVTGAAGFIGSHLVDSLLAGGYEVIGVDALTDYYSPEIKNANILRALAHDSYRFAGADLTQMDAREMRDLLHDVGSVLHLAAQPGVRGSWGRSFDVYLERNLLATQRLLEAVTNSEDTRFVFASSSSIYGSADDGPVSEDSPRRPTSPYGLTKLGGEELISVYRREHGLDATSLRYFTVYGPRQRPEMALANFISRAMDDQPIEVFGDGEQSREMTYVSDVVDATIAAMEKEGPGDVYNVGGGARTTINNVIDILRDILGLDMEVHYSERAAGDVRNTWADLSHTTKNLGYEPKVGLEEGIAAQVEYTREQRRAVR